MPNDLTLEWHPVHRRLHCNGVFRATPTDINKWRKNFPNPDLIVNHVTNTTHVGVGRWWKIQALHYGLEVGKRTNVQTVMILFRGSLVNGNPVVPPKIRALEEQCASGQATATHSPPPHTSPNQAYAYTPTGLEPVRAGPRRHPLRDASQTINTSGQESLSRANLKREAESDFEQRPSSRRYKPASF